MDLGRFGQSLVVLNIIMFAVITLIFASEGRRKKSPLAGRKQQTESALNPRGAKTSLRTS